MRQVSTLHHLQNQQVLKNLFPRPDAATVLDFPIFVFVDVQMQVGQAAARGQRRKAVIRDIFRCWSPRRNELECIICFTGERHCMVFRHMMQICSLSLALNRLNIPKILSHTTYKLVGFVDITSEDLPLLFLLGHDVSKETLVRLVVAGVRNVVQPVLVENSLLPEKRTKIVFNMMPQQTYLVHISSTRLPCLVMVFIRLCRLCLDINAKLLNL